MSKNIVIQEGGVGRQFTADKLKTALVGGGSCNWVPEDEAQLSTLTVSENGTYSAEDEGGYGYSQVIVNVPGGAGGPPGGEGSSIIGKDPDTGDNTLVQVDDSGTLKSITLPDRIEVTTLPAQLYNYEGQNIIYTGLVVKAYLKDGSLWSDETHPDGVIPISELTLPLEKAVLSGGYDTIWSNDNRTVNAIEVVCTEQSGWGWPPYYAFYGGNLGHTKEEGILGLCAYQNIGASFRVTKYRDEIYVMGLNEDNGCILAEIRNGVWGYYKGTYGWNPPKDKFGGPCQFSEGEYFFDNTPESTIDPTGVENLDLDTKHSTEQVPVQWMYDGVVTLETSYEIDVEAWPYSTPIGGGE